jgi:hypothetical protein
MRKMRMVGGSTIHNVCGWAITSNGWEYYFTDSKQKGDIRTSIVCGFETEMGDVSLTELQPYIRSITFKNNDLLDIAPAIGYEWVQ